MSPNLFSSTYPETQSASNPTPFSLRGCIGSRPALLLMLSAAKSRRTLREQVAVELTSMNAATAANWTAVEPLLDEAMNALDDGDRTAVLLRYFENKSLREVGEILSTTEEAARKRLSRAIDRLREFFTKRGVTVEAGGLAALISANSVQAAPAGLAAAITTAAFSGATVSTTATLAATKAIAMTTLQKNLITATIVVVAGAGIYEARQISRLRDENRNLTAKQEQLLNERDAALLARYREQGRT